MGQCPLLPPDHLKAPLFPSSPVTSWVTVFPSSRKRENSFFSFLDDCLRFFSFSAVRRVRFFNNPLCRNITGHLRRLRNKKSVFLSFSNGLFILLPIHDKNPLPRYRKNPLFSVRAPHHSFSFPPVEPLAEVCIKPLST